MRSGRADRFWMVGGAVVAIGLFLVGWFALISPQHGKASGLQDQTADAQTQIAKLQHRLNELREQSKDLDLYQSKLAAGRAALPSASALADFLRELQNAGTSTHVVISGVAVGAPTQASSAGTAVYAVPVTLTTSGTESNLETFLNELQRIQPRAALVTGAKSAASGAGSLSGGADMSISLNVFVTSSPAATPSASATPN